MFKIYHGDQASAVNVDDYYIKESSSGLDELVFEIPITDENYPYILEERPWWSSKSISSRPLTQTRRPPK